MVKLTSLMPGSVHHSDILVIGGGPAGSTVSTLLQRKGWTVTLLEKEYHPRFHIGESLLPRNLDVFKKLGVLEEVEKIGIKKLGADFTPPFDNSEYVMFDFSKAMDPEYPTAFQVRRSEFDHLLLENSKKNDVNVLEGYDAVSFDLSQNDQVTVVAKDESNTEHTFNAKFLIDASGRDTFLSSKLKLKQKNPKHNSAAVFGHFSGVTRREGEHQGNISIYWFDYGWFWLIPLKDGTTSIGAVCWPEYLKMRNVPLDEFLLNTIKRCEPLYERVKDGKLETKATATGNFSYQSKKLFGNNYMLVGDAFAFIDPIFSTGVFVAMYSAGSASEAVSKYLQDPGRSTAPFKRHQNNIIRGIKTFSWLIYRFNSPAIRFLFVNPNNRYRIVDAMITLLTGDVFRDTPIKKPLFIFKIIYYIFSLSLFKSSITAYLHRRAQVKIMSD